MHDGSIYSTNTTANVATTTNHFTVTAGASVMVAALLDFNGEANSSSPSFLVWSNTTLGSTQMLTQAVTTNEQAGTYSDSDLYYLFNPSVGTGVIYATDTNSTAPSTMFLQTYTLSGVDATVTPFAAGNGNSTASHPFSDYREHDRRGLLGSRDERKLQRRRRKLRNQHLQQRSRADADQPAGWDTGLRRLHHESGLRRQRHHVIGDGIRHAYGHGG